MNCSILICLAVIASVFIVPLGLLGFGLRDMYETYVAVFPMFYLVNLVIVGIVLLIRRQNLDSNRWILHLLTPVVGVYTALTIKERL